MTRNIIDNLDLNGSTPTEQDHLSIVEFNGDVMLGSICEYLKSLMERQQHICNKENNVDTDFMNRSHRYIPVLDGEYGSEEILARQVFSSISHKTYFIKQLQLQNLCRVIMIPIISQIISDQLVKLMTDGMKVMVHTIYESNILAGIWSTSIISTNMN